MVQNLWEKITENLGFVENSNFIRGNREAAVRGKFKRKYLWWSPIVVKLQDLSF